MLRLARRLQSLHLPLPPPGRLVGVLRPVVQPFVLPVLDRGHHLALGGLRIARCIGAGTSLLQARIIGC